MSNNLKKHYKRALTIAGSDPSGGAGIQADLKTFSACGRNAWVFKALFGWSDLGTWDSLYMYIDKDENGNIVNAANTMLSGVHNCAIYTDKSYKLMSLSGLDDYMVIDTDDVLMVCPRNEDNFKNMITDLAVKNKKSFQ